MNWLASTTTADPTSICTSYGTIYHVYTTAMYARYQHLLERHKLMEKFLDEDSKGSR